GGGFVGGSGSGGDGLEKREVVLWGMAGKSAGEQWELFKRREESVDHIMKLVEVNGCMCCDFFKVNFVGQGGCDRNGIGSVERKVGSTGGEEWRKWWLGGERMLV
nr:hypothetical protein [Tanacetum cinerariifolium]